MISTFLIRLLFNRNFFLKRQDLMTKLTKHFKGGEDPSLSDHQQYNYMSGDESKHLQDDHHYNMDVTDVGEEKMVERILSGKYLDSPSSYHLLINYKTFKTDAEKYNYMEKSRLSRDSTPNPLDISLSDNCQIVRNPIHAG